LLSPNNTSVRLSNVGDALFQMFNDIFIETKPLIDQVLNSTLAGIKSLGEGIKETIGFIKEHKTAIEFLITAFVTYKGIMLSLIIIEKAYAGWIALKTAYQVAAFLATGNLTVAQWALNAAMYANPISLVIAAIAALVAGVIALYKHFGSLSAMITGVWGIIKAFANGVGNTFFALGKVIAGALTFNPELIAKGLSEVVSSAKTAAFEIGEAWNKGQAIDVTKPGAIRLPGKVGATTTTTEKPIASPKTKAEGQKTINIHVAYNAPLIQGFTISTTNIKEGLQSLKEQVSAILVGATHDTLMVADN